MFALAGGVALFLSVRWLHVSRLKRLLGQSLSGVPPELEEAWLSGPSAGYGTVMAAGGVTVADAVFQLHRIDPGVLKAIDAAKGGQAFENYNQLVEQVESVAGRGKAAVQGLVSNYKGYYGEQILADTLRANGHHVEMADSPNQEGWDALVDGQPVQFKVGLGTGSIEDHLAKNPDIPVFTVGEHAQAYADNDMVTAVEGTSGSEIQETVEHTLEGIDGLDDVAFDFPLVTLMVSGAKNARLVAKGHSDGWTAVEYTVADTVAVGGGGAIGGKTGAVIGGLLGGPFGAAVGGIIGGIGGAMAGRSLSNDYKEQGLRQAQSSLESALARHPAAYAQALKAKGQALASSAEQAQPRGLGAWFWPSMGTVAAAETAERYAQWSSSCASDAQSVEADLASAVDQDDRATIARTLIASGAEPAFSKELQRASNRVRRASDLVTAELGKLGRLA